jgi:DNA-binding protein H-NS
MTSLASIKKQIAALEAEAARITKAEAAAAIAKIKELMSTFGLTAEHLGLAAVRNKRAIAKKSAPKRVGAGTPKYADPKTGKTWSGFGRAPTWIASAKSRDAFLVDKSGLEVIARAAKTPAASKKAAAKPVKSSKPAKKTATGKTARAAKKAAAPAVASKKTPAAKKAVSNKPAAKKGAVKFAVTKSAPKKKASKGAAASQVATEAPVTAAA